MKKRVVFSLLLLLGLFISLARAQQQHLEAPAGAASAQKVQIPMTEERKAFELKLVEYKDCLKQTYSLKNEYQTATAERKDKIRTEYGPLIEKATGLQKQLIPLAIASYKVSGDKDPEVLQFLFSMLEWKTVSCEDYETAYQIASVVCQQPLPENIGPILYAYAAFTAFNVMQLEDAEKWYKLADEKGGIEKADPRDEMRIRTMLNYGLPLYKKLWPAEQAIRAKEATEELPRVRMKTTKGDIVLELFKNEAPNAVGNFLTLVDKGFYKNVPFHRVLPFFMAQGGDPTGSGTGGPGYAIPCECSQKNARMHFRGSISMAHAGTDTGGSQFFLTFIPTFFLNNKHTVFGRVVEGMEVLSELQRINPEEENLPAPDKIISASIERGKPFDFKKLPSRR